MSPKPMKTKVTLRSWPTVAHAVSLCLLVLLTACTVNEDDLPSSASEPRRVYFMVTHGPTTDAGFWGDVLTPTLSKARELGVAVVPLHPAIEASGPLLNEQMLQAINVNPPGIIGTIWGEGMPDTIKIANAQGIPIAAINVYPDPALFGDGMGRAKFLFYAGQNDALAAEDVSAALVCSALDKRLQNGSCQDQTVAETFTQVSSGRDLRAVCIVHQQSAGVLSRCAAMRATMLALGLVAERYEAISWDEASPGAGVPAIENYFNAPQRAAVDVFLVMANGGNGVDPYFSASIDNATRNKIVFGTFDTSTAICNGLRDRRIRFASGQGHTRQGSMALAYLDYFVSNGQLPVPGLDPQGNTDANWIVSPDGFPWYKTGPELFYEACPE